MGFPKTVEQIAPGTLIQISVVGTKNEAAGRSTAVVNVTTDLLGLIGKYSNLKQSAEMDMAKVSELTKNDIAQAIAYMAEFQAAQQLAGSATLADVIVDATANFLVGAHGMIESETDPGTTKFYFNRGDLTPQWVNGKGGLYYCLVALTAPFGLVG